MCGQICNQPVGAVCILTILRLPVQMEKSFHFDSLSFILIVFGSFQDVSLKFCFLNS